MGERNSNPPRAALGLARRLKHVYACLVHEAPDCVADLVRNLQWLDPASAVLLYNGCADKGFLSASAWAEHGVAVHPSPRPMVWGRLHDFALDCMEFALAELPFDLMTFVDSDQLLLRRGYTEFLGANIELEGLGLLSSHPGRRSAADRNHGVRTAWRELHRWRPWLRQFPNGVDRFVHFSFWPGTVFTRVAASRVVRRCRSDNQLKSLLAKTRLSVTEEVLLPTLVTLLGLRVDQNPACQNWVRWRATYCTQACREALAKNDAFFIHPVPRHLDDPVRSCIRAHHSGYV